jgi:hypothetical protein
MSAMSFSFTVNVTAERDEGKFASKDELRDQCREALEGADPGTIEGENGGQYSVTDWSVEDA